MSITSGIRLALAVLGLTGLTHLSIVTLRDLQGAAPGWPRAESVTESVLGYGLVDVEQGICRLAPAIPGCVKEVCVRENDDVEAGAVLLRLEDESARLRLWPIRAELAEAEMQLEDAQQEPRRYRARLVQQKEAVKAARNKRAMSQHQLDRIRRLAKENLYSERDVQDAENVLQTFDVSVRIEQARLEELQLRDPSLPEARARKLVEARQTQLELAEHDLRQYELRAPEKGKVLRILVSQGDFFSPAAGQPALYFCPDRPRIVRAEVGQEWASRLSSGQKVLLQDDEDPSLQWCGEVRRVSDWLTLRRSVWPGPQEMLDQRTAECIIQPKSDPQRLRIGQKLRVMLSSGGR